MKKEIEEDIKIWKDFPCLWISRIKIMNMVILQKTIYIFNIAPIRIPMTFLTEIEKSTLKFIWKHRRPQIAKPMLSKKSNTRYITLLTSNYTTEP
jgi:hypothetical protein